MAEPLEHPPLTAPSPPPPAGEAADPATRAAQLHRALQLGWFTVSWNVLEGIIAISAAYVAGSRALLGFGFDSFVESISASVLIWRLRAERRDPERAAAVETRAVKLIGLTFFLLAAVVGFEAVRSLLTASEPESSPVGIALTALSVLVMPFLARRKRVLAAEMDSKAVAADGNQTKACVYLSVVVLGGLVLNAVLGWWWADPVAALGVVVILLQEGRDALAAGRVDDCC